MTDKTQQAPASPVRGRPTDYSSELATEICVKLMEGRSLKSITSEESMPSQSTVYRWLLVHPEFQERYTHARECQAETIADECIDIADDGRNDWVEREMRNGRTEIVLDKEAVMRSQLRVSTRQWFAAKLKPRKYSDKLQLTGNNDGPIETRDADAMTDAQLEAIARRGRAAPAEPTEGEG